MFGVGADELKLSFDLLSFFMDADKEQELINVIFYPEKDTDFKTVPPLTRGQRLLQYLKMPLNLTFGEFSKKD